MTRSKPHGPKSRSSSRFIPERQAGVPALTKAELAELVSLKKKRGRRDTGLYLAEGVRLLEEALRARIEPKALFEYPPELSERAQSVVNGFRARNVPIRTVNSRDFHKLVDTEQPQGLVGVFKTASTQPDYEMLKKYKRFLVADNISDPGNLGALVRSAVGFGFDAIMLLGDSVEPYNPKLVRSTAGAIFNCHFYELPLNRLGEFKSKTKSHIIACDLAGDRIEQSSQKIRSWINADAPICVVVGSESDGCSPESLKSADLSLSIAHSPLIESLNASVAGAIIMSHIYSMQTNQK